MLILTKGQRAVLVEKLPDFASVAAGAMFFGQFLSDRPFSPAVAVFGLVTWIGSMILTMVLAGKDTGQ